MYPVLPPRQESNLHYELRKPAFYPLNYGEMTKLYTTNRHFAHTHSEYATLLVMITEGNKAPAFSSKNQNGETVSLTDVAGKRAVLYFYPKDDTPGCTTEGLEFSALREEFEKHNTKIFGISKDTVKSHKKFCDKHKFSIDLLSDEDGNMLEAYDAWGEKNTFGKKTMGIIRSTVLIDENGTIVKHWKNVQAQGHAQKVLQFIVSL